MSNLTTADIRYRITDLNGDTFDVAIVVADRAGADALARKFGWDPASHELKMYAAAYHAARRASTLAPQTWEEFALNVLDVALITVDGRPVKAVNGAFIVADDEEVEEDPTRPVT